jgi:hypothetical protein
VTTVKNTKEGETMKRYKRIIFAVMAFSLAWGISPAHGGNEESLRGLNCIAVLIEQLRPEMEQAGLYRSQIQTDVELKLRLSGIKVLTKEEGLKEKGASFIYINVNSFKQRPQGLFIYNIYCELGQNVFLERNHSIKIFATTWREIGWLGIGDIKDIREAIKERIDIFINAYLSVNPKK